ncbi:glycerol-3-phosphate dehydrogenase/oxidase [Simiduia agarivorans]|uniref:FAD-dependent glycerol-3-phosphate dehydrogenase n=1 Tax=Simiduia agarivorans (strain DSM 21679 / JCM 13881 / BCRC 17597 / SA1) TaxID=1117647 RepID=K4KF10_SIMAS|nr:glycerol-3-phosphate dehydrogenase/oxidase [Simiduia agarivorans]AFU97536.1 FAD-dependent glycerol-3-phosphate dehydrogenase [Simiduia agarivorans SA1 = DSM 21679]
MQSRTAILEALAGDQQWDLVVVGGGITGAGVLLSAARAGLKVLLVEQQDFAWGTSSRSSKMVHGGLRYLAQGDISLTRHSVQEREYLLKSLPGLVRPLEYHYVLGADTPPRIGVKLLLLGYDWLAGVANHRYLNRQAFGIANPGFNLAHTHGAYAYYDAGTDDSRLVIRVLQEAVDQGARCLNYCQVTQLHCEAGQVSQLELLDQVSGQGFKLNAKVVVNATGAWADRLRNVLNPEVRVRPQRGSHIVLPIKRLPVDHALTLRHPDDGRYHFIFPWAGRTIVGTTDLDHRADLDAEAHITAEEIDYLLASANHFYPQARLTRDDILSTWSGVRPIIGSENAVDPSKERRDHAVWVDGNLVTVSGGKLTTFRLIAGDVLAAIGPLIGREQVNEQTSGADWISPVDMDPTSLYEQGAELAPQYLARYGAHAAALVQGALDEGRVEELLPISDTGYSLADLRWALRHEQALTLADVLLRHSPLGLVLPDGAESLMESLAGLFEDECGVGKTEFAKLVIAYRDTYRQSYSVS